MPAKGYRRFVAAVLVILCHVHFLARGDQAILLHKDQSSPSTWQWLSRFEFGTWGGWSQEGNSGSYTVCDLSETATNDTNSWLVSEYVDLQGANEVHIGLSFMVRQCPVELTYCKQSFKLHVLHAQGPIAGGITKNAIESGNFTPIATVNADFLWTPSNPLKMNQANLTFVAKGKGAYLAFQDTGACLALKSVALSYAYCPSIVNYGVLFKKVAAPSSSHHSLNVSGDCSDKASPFPSNSSLALSCLSSGQWVTNSKVTCQCTAGYELVGDTCTGCKAGFYKMSVGNEQCIPCPSNSAPSNTHDSCPCQKGFYRAPQDVASDSCTAPPSGPRDINVTVVTDSVVIVTWSHPAYDGGRSDVKYDLKCSECSESDSCRSNCSGVQFWPSLVDLSTTQVTISNLNSAMLYNLTVISKNGVSDQSGASLLKYLHKTFSLKNPATPTSPTTPTDIATQENLTTIKVKVEPVQGTAGSQVASAIAISVAVTFVVCFVIAAVVIFLLIKFWRRKHFEQQSVQSSSTQLTELSRGDTPLKTLRSETATTELSETGSIPDKHFDHKRSDSIPVIQIYDANSNSRPTSADSNRSLPKSKYKIKPCDWTPPRSITPVLLPQRLKTGLRKERSVSTSNLMDSPRKPPEGSDLERRTERSPSLNSWFPEEEVQYNV